MINANTNHLVIYVHAVQSVAFTVAQRFTFMADCFDEVILLQTTHCQV
jgi:hypothetical protein